jgi:hypothetical protein
MAHSTPDVGGSPNRSAEDIRDEEGKEPGREDTGTDSETGRPTGTSTARDMTGVDPQDPVTTDPDQVSG